MRNSQSANFAIIVLVLMGAVSTETARAQQAVRGAGQPDARQSGSPADSRRLSCQNFRAAASYTSSVLSRCGSATESGYISINPACAVLAGAVTGGALNAILRWETEVLYARQVALERTLPAFTRAVLARYNQALARRAEALGSAGFRGELSAARRAELATVERELAELRSQLRWLYRSSPHSVPVETAQALGLLQAQGPASELEAAAASRIEREVGAEVARRVVDESEVPFLATSSGLSGGMVGALVGLVGGAALESMLNFILPEHSGDPSEATVSSVVAHPEVLFSAPPGVACRYLEAYASVREAVAPLVAQILGAREQAAREQELMVAAADSARIPREVLEDPRPLLPASTATEAITGRGI